MKLDTYVHGADFHIAISYLYISGLLRRLELLKFYFYSYICLVNVSKLTRPHTMPQTFVMFHAMDALVGCGVGVCWPLMAPCL